MFFFGIVASAVKKISYCFQIKASDNELQNSVNAQLEIGPSAMSEHTGCVALMLLQFRECLYFIYFLVV